MKTMHHMPGNQTTKRKYTEDTHCAFLAQHINHHAVNLQGKVKVNRERYDYVDASIPILADV